MSNQSSSIDFPYYACKVGNTQTIIDFLNSEASLDTKLHSPYRMLMVASKNGHLEIVKLLLNSSFSKNDRKYDNIKDYISEATQKGYLDIVKYLVDTSIFQEETDDAKYARIILFASSSGQIDVLKYALDEFKDDPMTKKVLENARAIEAACEEGQLETIKFLLKLPIERKDKGLVSFFKSAYEYNQLETIQYFIFDLNLEKNDAVIYIMNKNTNIQFYIQVEQLFATRDLKTSLDKELTQKENLPSKKIKV